VIVGAVLQSCVLCVLLDVGLALVYISPLHTPWCYIGLKLILPAERGHLFYIRSTNGSNLVYSCRLDALAWLGVIAAAMIVAAAGRTPRHASINSVRIHETWTTVVGSEHAD